MFDQDRGTLHTGENLSVALGGSPINSDSATTFGDAYLVDGWAGIVIYSGLAALVTGIVIRRQGPWAYALLAMITQNCLLVESGYPDMLAGLLQACVSLIVAILMVRHSAIESFAQTCLLDQFGRRRSALLETYTKDRVAD